MKLLKNISCLLVIVFLVSSEVNAVKRNFGEYEDEGIGGASLISLSTLDPEELHEAALVAYKADDVAKFTNYPAFLNLEKRMRNGKSFGEILAAHKTPSQRTMYYLATRFFMQNQEKKLYKKRMMENKEPLS